ncbi:MAG: endodeoxyribonuclease RusA [Armatimonadia bacterium]
MKIILPWPPKELSPNARSHWSKKAKAAKSYRHACRIITFASGIKAPDGRVLLVLEFVPPNRQRRDDDNLVAAFKAGRDGIADALGIDDSRFTTQFSMRAEPVKDGAVIVEIREAE